jgi:hypothetical protein
LPFSAPLRLCARMFLPLLFSPFPVPVRDHFFSLRASRRCVRHLLLFLPFPAPLRLCARPCFWALFCPALRRCRSIPQFLNSSIPNLLFCHPLRPCVSARVIFRSVFRPAPISAYFLLLFVFCGCAKPLLSLFLCLSLFSLRPCASARVIFRLSGELSIMPGHS